MKTLCDRCTAPGSCCKDIRLSYKHPGLHKLEIRVWLASVIPVNNEIGLPFLPDILVPVKWRNVSVEGELSPLEIEWSYSCINLTEDGRCGDYANRPQLCRDFTPGYNQPCVMNHRPCPAFVEE